MDQVTVDFLGIGVQRGASTWLWSNLRKHPDIWLPPVKELHYFDRSLKYRSPSYLADDRLLDRLFSEETHNRKFQRILKRNLTKWMPKALLQRDFETLIWRYRYLSGHINDDWYRSLFKPGQGKIKGDITPAYSILESDDIAHIKSLFPDIKIILILRNPMDRAWSYVCYESQQRRFHGMDDLQKVKGVINGPTQTMRGDYLSILETWESHFPADQIYIGFYEDVLQRPGYVINEIFDFLNVDRKKFKYYASLKSKVNSSNRTEKEIPPEIQYILARKYYYQIKLLKERFGGHTQQWLNEASEILQKNQAPSS